MTLGLRSRLQLHTAVFFARLPVLKRCTPPLIAAVKRRTATVRLLQAQTCHDAFRQTQKACGAQSPQAHKARKRLALELAGQKQFADAARYLAPAFARPGKGWLEAQEVAAFVDIAQAFLQAQLTEPATQLAYKIVAEAQLDGDRIAAHDIIAAVRITEALHWLKNDKLAERRRCLSEGEAAYHWALRLRQDLKIAGNARLAQTSFVLAEYYELRGYPDRVEGPLETGIAAQIAVDGGTVSPELKTQIERLIHLKTALGKAIEAHLLRARYLRTA